MSLNTFSYCMKCKSLNKVSIEKIEEQTPLCGSCKTSLKLHSLVSEVDHQGLAKMIQKADRPVVVDFWAPWCGPCKIFAPTFEAASKAFAGKIIFIKINTQDYPHVSEQFNIRGIPSLLVFKDGNELARQSGAFPLDTLKSWLMQMI